MYLVSEVFPEDGYNFKEVLLSCINKYYNEYKSKKTEFAQLSKGEKNIKVEVSRENILSEEKGEELCTIIT